MSRARFVSILAAVLTIAGCALLKDIDTGSSPRPDVIEGMAEPGTELDRLLRYFHRIRKLSSAELMREQNSARLSYTRRQSDFHRVRLAMALSPPSTSGGDPARALELLDTLVKNPNSGLHALAFLMSAYLQDQRRLENNAYALQQKLDNLKSMEKNMLERERAGVKRP